MSTTPCCTSCAHAIMPIYHPTCRQCIDSPGPLLVNWTPIEVIPPAPETVPQAKPEVVAVNVQPVCDTCGHVALPTAHPTCHQCFFHHDAPPSNWIPIKVVPKVPDTSEDVVYGYGCPTCKFSAVDPNAAPCRGCWSPSVSGKGSNWTAP